MKNLSNVQELDLAYSGQIHKAKKNTKCNQFFSCFLLKIDHVIITISLNLNRTTGKHLSKSWFCSINTFQLDYCCYSYRTLSRKYVKIWVHSVLFNIVFTATYFFISHHRLVKCLLVSKILNLKFNYPLPYFII